MRGATGGQCIHQVDGNISIHAPHAGRDDNPAFRRRINQLFQSTRPMRGATFRKAHDGLVIGISIHAPHAGRDPDLPDCRRLPCDFNPRAPCGARPGFWAVCIFTTRKFQSTRPMRGATRSDLKGRRECDISIHAPHAGRDPCPEPTQRWSQISIHAPHAGRDAAMAASSCTTASHFNPRAPCGARQQKYTKLLYTLLRQKAILRQFHAKRRLLKRFSTYKYRNTFLICSANRMGKICTLPLRTTRSLDLPEGMSACSQSARFCFRTFFPSSKTADYPAPNP